MPILGIDYDKCSNCGICIYACTHPDYYFSKNEEGKVLYNDHGRKCIQCGQCIAQCPEEAVLYDGIGEPFTFEGVEAPETIIPYETIFNALAACRSIRRYKKENVPQDILDKVIRAMTYAPTGANIRAENFTIISDQSVLKSLSDAIIQAYKTNGLLWQQFGENISKNQKIFEVPIYFDAPHVFIVSSPMNMIIGAFNFGNIITYGRLAAQSLGLGTCWNGWTQLGVDLNPKIKRIAKIRGNLVCAFTIGYPKTKYYRVPPRSQKNVEVI